MYMYLRSGTPYKARIGGCGWIEDALKFDLTRLIQAPFQFRGTTRLCAMAQALRPENAARYLTVLHRLMHDLLRSG